MKKSTKIASILFMGAALVSCSGVTANPAFRHLTNKLADCVCLDTCENEPFEGMHFSSANITQHYEYDGECCFAYTDPDAGMWNAEIVVDADTWNSTLAACERGETIIGDLYLRQDNGEYRVYGIKPDEPEN